jgi:3D (Asp-Asp-Asp) domain-containing protein
MKLKIMLMVLNLMFTIPARTVMINLGLAKMPEPVEEVSVTLTTYTASVAETDSTPFITASGFKLNKKNPKKHRIIAVSRDLKKKYKFGQRVKVKGAGKLDGVYVVHDVMNKRYKKRIDVLINKKDKQVKYRNIKISKLEDTLD